MISKSCCDKSEHNKDEDDVLFVHGFFLGRACLNRLFYVEVFSLEQVALKTSQSMILYGRIYFWETDV